MNGRVATPLDWLRYLRISHPGHVIGGGWRSCQLPLSQVSQDYIAVWNDDPRFIATVNRVVPEF